MKPKNKKSLRGIYHTGCLLCYYDLLNDIANYVLIVFFHRLKNAHHDYHRNSLHGCYLNSRYVHV